MTDSRGVYRKFEVKRTDGSDEPGGKHDGCTYFVLDLEHDRHALVALAAYADSCAEERPELASDLRAIVATRPCGCRAVGECGHLFTPQTPNEAMVRALSRASGEEASST